MSDLISRQTAIDVARKELESGTYFDIPSKIEALPAVHPEVIRCKDCKHRHVENMIWTCPFGLPGGENFFCGYGAEPYKGE